MDKHLGCAYFAFRYWSGACQVLRSVSACTNLNLNCIGGGRSMRIFQAPVRFRSRIFRARSRPIRKPDGNLTPGVEPVMFANLTSLNIENVI